MIRGVFGQTWSNFSGTFNPSPRFNVVLKDHNSGVTRGVSVVEYKVACGLCGERTRAADHSF